MKLAGGQAEMGGHGVERELIQPGMPVCSWYSNAVLTGIIASEDGVERRRCGHCRRELQAGDFDHNGQGRLLLTCRHCLVCYSTLQGLLKDSVFGN